MKTLMKEFQFTFPLQKYLVYFILNFNFHYYLNFVTIHLIQPNMLLMSYKQIVHHHLIIF